MTQKQDGNHWRGPPRSEVSEPYTGLSGGPVLRKGVATVSGFENQQGLLPRRQRAMGDWDAALQVGCTNPPDSKIYHGGSSLRRAWVTHGEIKLNNFRAGATGAGISGNSIRAKNCWKVSLILLLYFPSSVCWKICHSALTKHHSPLPGIPLRSYPGPSNTHAQAGTPPKQLQTSHIQWLALAHTAAFPKPKCRNKGICSKGNRTKSQKKEWIKMETSNLTDKRVQHTRLLNELGRRMDETNENFN